MSEHLLVQRAVRSLFVFLTLSAWLALSNHCALGAIAASAASTQEMGGCPMHSAPRKIPATKTPCCKDLRATVAKSVSTDPITLRLLSSLDYAPEIFRSLPRFAIEIENLDTGPPHYFSFAESVLQESMLSHAPPVSQIAL